MCLNVRVCHRRRRVECVSSLAQEGRVCLNVRVCHKRRRVECVSTSDCVTKSRNICLNVSVCHKKPECSACNSLCHVIVWRRSSACNSLCRVNVCSRRSSQKCHVASVVTGSRRMAVSMQYLHFLETFYKIACVVSTCGDVLLRVIASSPNSANISRVYLSIYLSMVSRLLALRV